MFEETPPSARLDTSDMFRAIGDATAEYSFCSSTGENLYYRKIHSNTVVPDQQ